MCRQPTTCTRILCIRMYSTIYSCLIWVTFSSHSFTRWYLTPSLFPSLSYNPCKDVKIFCTPQPCIPSLQTQPTFLSTRLNSLFCPTSSIQFSQPCIQAHPIVYPINIYCIPTCTTAHSCPYSITANLLPACTTAHFSLCLTTFDASPACISQSQPSPGQPGATPGWAAAWKIRNRSAGLQRSLKQEMRRRGGATQTASPCSSFSTSTFTSSIYLSMFFSPSISPSFSSSASTFSVSPFVLNHLFHLQTTSSTSFLLPPSPPVSLLILPLYFCLLQSPLVLYLSLLLHLLH